MIKRLLPSLSLQFYRLPQKLNLTHFVSSMVGRVKDSLREAAAGALAGATTKTIMAPLDRIKLVVQLRGSLGKHANAYGGPWMAFHRVVRNEGIGALWRGNLSTVVIHAGTVSLNFMFMDWYKQAAAHIIVRVDQQQHHFANSFLSAALAGCTSITLLYPIGLARTKLALDVGQKNRKFPNGMRDVFRHSIQTNGMGSLFQGYGVALASVSLYRMIHLGGYDYIKTEMFQRNGLPTDADATRLSFGERFVAAQVVSMTASTVHYPLDSVRRRLMMQSDAEMKHYRNTMDCFAQIYMHEGVRGCFRGLGTSYIRSVGAALLLVSYDFFKSVLF